MANLVSVERADLSFGTVHVLDSVSLGVGEGDAIGVVGRNGGGKSTLLRVLGGRQDLDGGRAVQTGDLTVGYLPQGDHLAGDATVRSVVVGGAPEHEWAADARVRDVLRGLLGGIDAAGVGGLDARCGVLSGGEGRRVALAGLLVADPDLLLLDEPTNHLDVEGVAWLAGYLARRRDGGAKALVTVTHDRWFLDAVATLTWEVVDGTVEGYEGGYAAYVLAKAERERIGTATEQRRGNLLRKELAWLRRGPPARTTKPRFRLDAAASLIEAEPPPRDEVELVSFATRRLGKDVIDLVDARVELGDRVILDEVTWRLAPGERVGIVGVNGTGKTTLLRAFLGEVPLAAGRRKIGATVVTAYLSQSVVELGRLADRRVVEAISDVRSHIALGKSEVSASRLATMLGFSGPRQRARVAELSGGERRRLQILRLLMTEPNVLFLDEPTNDLDIETLTALEDVLDGWAGALLVVSHDRYLLERMCDRQVALLGDGRVRDLPGGVEEYLALRAALTDEQEVTRVSSGGAAAARPAGPSPRAEELRQARKEMSRIERRLGRIEEAETSLHVRMADQAHDHQKVLGLDTQLRQLRAEREGLEQSWLEAAELTDA